MVKLVAEGHETHASGYHKDSVSVYNFSAEPVCEESKERRSDDLGDDIEGDD